ncbi:hypothetical protein HDU67_002633 [Dinochytrium kinnereticum]|nr:hypothetical protein HDU67_002633 [Dinochytrium kinnereticum]
MHREDAARGETGFAAAVRSMSASVFDEVGTEPAGAGRQGEEEASSNGGGCAALPAHKYSAAADALAAASAAETILDPNTMPSQHPQQPAAASPSDLPKEESTARGQLGPSHSSLLARTYTLAVHLLSAVLHLFNSIHTRVASWTLQRLSVLGTSFFVVQSEVQGILSGPLEAPTGHKVDATPNDKASKDAKPSATRRLIHVAAVLKPELVEASSKPTWPLRLFWRSFFEKSSEGKVVEGERGKKIDVSIIELMVDDISKLACWCLASGVDHLSVYDRSGTLKANRDLISSQLSKTFLDFAKPIPRTPLSLKQDNKVTSPSDSKLSLFRISVAGKDDTMVTFSSPPLLKRVVSGVKLAEEDEGWEVVSDIPGSPALSSDQDSSLRKRRPAGSGPGAKDTVGPTSTVTRDVDNGNMDVIRLLQKERRMLSIHLLDEEDGKGAVAQAAREMAEKGGKATVDVKTLESLLNKAGVPEPQLLYVFGDVTEPLTLEGYPPWMIRVTEMWQVKGDGRVRYQDFLRGLYKFSRCIQRFGR